jgi:hypothetical protein
MQHMATNYSQLQLTIQVSYHNIHKTSVEITVGYNIKLSSTVPTLQLREEIKTVIDGLSSACMRACICLPVCLLEIDS